jgi:hypothetical protein
VYTQAAESPVATHAALATEFGKAPVDSGSAARMGIGALVRRELAGVALYDARLVALGGSLLLTGGFGERPSSGLRQHLLTGSTWRQLPAGQPSDRGGHAVDVVGNHAILHGGYSHGQGNLAELWAASLEGDESPSWCKLAPGGTAPLARAGHTLTRVSDNELVLFGGYGQEALDDLHVLRIEPNGESSWRPLPASGESPGPRCAHAAVSVPSRRHERALISVGGYTASGADAALSLLTISPCGMEGHWTPLHARGPLGHDGMAEAIARSGHSALIASGNRLLVFGGTREGRTPGEVLVLGDMLCLDVSDVGLERLRHPAGGARWERLVLDAEEESLARYNHAAAIVQAGRDDGEEEILLVVGGTDAAHVPVETAAALRVPSETDES